MGSYVCIEMIRLITYSCIPINTYRHVCCNVCFLLFLAISVSIIPILEHAWVYVCLSPRKRVHYDPRHRFLFLLRLEGLSWHSWHLFVPLFSSCCVRTGSVCCTRSTVTMEVALQIERQSVVNVFCYSLVFFFHDKAWVTFCNSCTDSNVVLQPNRYQDMQFREAT